jgi:membrane protein implicated in regulation of membrane protease activity
MPAFLQRTYLLWTALAAIVLGYFLLGSGDITAAPLLLVAGYCILVPLFLWRAFRDGSGE